jgi:hypothetical protein
MENFIYSWKIKEETCDELISYYHLNKNELGQSGCISSNNEIFENKNIKDSYDVYFYNQSQNKTIKKYFNELTIGLLKYMKKYSISDMVLNTEVINNIQYYPSGGGYKIWHCERRSKFKNRVLVYMTYLNTIKNGGTEWLYQNYNTEAIKGLTVIWPAEFTHLHRGIITNQEKYIATGWFEMI